MSHVGLSQGQKRRLFPTCSFGLCHEVQARRIERPRHGGPQGKFRAGGAVLVELDGEDDHVHLLVEYLPTVQLTKLVNSLKGVSSRMLRKKRFPEVEDKLWGGHLWSPSYFAASCGGAPIDIVRKYIEDQRA